MTPARALFVGAGTRFPGIRHQLQQQEKGHVGAAAPETPGPSWPLMSSATCFSSPPEAQAQTITAASARAMTSGPIPSLHFVERPANSFGASSLFITIF